MSDKQKKFEPSIGWINTINHQRVMILALAEALEIDAVVLGQALDNTGHKLDVDTFNLANDTWRLINFERKSKPDLSVVPEGKEQTNE